MKKAALLLLFCLLTQNAAAETSDFGGYSERYKGGGDKIPPECQIDVPRTASAAFFVKWNCSDDNSSSDEIRTELWIYRRNAEAGQLIANFLGFPASVQIDEHILQAAAVTDGLPVGFKLLARDGAGITTISPLISVRLADNSLNSCDLSIRTTSTVSNGGTTGTPALSVVVSNAEVTVRETSSTRLIISTAQAAAASPCEIESLCSENSAVSFSAQVTLGDNGTASGTLTANPGSFAADPLEGTADSSNQTLNRLSLTGSSTVDGQDASVTLICAK